VIVPFHGSFFAEKKQIEKKTKRKTQEQKMTGKIQNGRRHEQNSNNYHVILNRLSSEEKEED